LIFRITALLLALFVAAGCAPLSPAPAPTTSPASLPASTPTISPSATSTLSKSGVIREYELSIQASMRDLPLLMALDALKAEGYTVETTKIATSATIVDALTRGDADVATIDDQTAWIAASKGAKIQTIVQRSRSSMLMVARSDIKGCGDLTNKPVALSTPTGLNVTLFNLFYKENCPGIKPQVIIIPDSTSRVAALLGGQVVAEQLQSEDLLRVDQQAPGRFHALITLSAEFPEMEVYGIQVRREWAQQNPAIVKDLIRALLTVHRNFAADPQLLYAEAVKRLAIDPGLAEKTGEAYRSMQMWDPNGGATRESIQATLNVLAGDRILPSSLNVDDVADLSYLNAVLSEIGRK
jgi:ABC-type nitrate/sulfonate/bicarbonate transport system substrate-binding protein